MYILEHFYLVWNIDYEISVLKLILTRWLFGMSNSSFTKWWLLIDGSPKEFLRSDESIFMPLNYNETHLSIIVCIISSNLKQLLLCMFSVLVKMQLKLLRVDLSSSESKMENEFIQIFVFARVKMNPCFDCLLCKIGPCRRT